MPRARRLPVEVSPGVAGFIQVPPMPERRRGLLLILEVTKDAQGKASARWAYIPEPKKSVMRE